MKKYQVEYVIPISKFYMLTQETSYKKEHYLAIVV